MAANVVNSIKYKLNVGRPINLGTITNANDAVQFSVGSPSKDFRGKLVFQFVGGTNPTPKLEFSLDGATSWTDIAFIGTTNSADFGDTAALGGTANIDGMGGASFRLGRSDANGGGAVVWALVG